MTVVSRETDPGNQWYAPRHIPSCRVRILARLADGQSLPVVGSFDRQGMRRWHLLAGRTLRPLISEIRAWQPLSKGWTWPNGLVPPPLDDTDAALSLGLSERLLAEPYRGLDEPQWWRDGTLITYEAMGKISPRHGEARIMRALVLERSIRMDMASYTTNGAALARMKMSLADVLAEEPDADWVPPLMPLEQDHRDYLTVMGWLIEVMPSAREMRILRDRMGSPPRSWVQIGDRISRDASRARQLYQGAIADLVVAGNRRPRRSPARLSELQKRNREARL